MEGKVRLLRRGKRQQAFAEQPFTTKTLLGSESVLLPSAFRSILVCIYGFISDSVHVPAWSCIGTEHKLLVGVIRHNPNGRLGDVTPINDSIRHGKRLLRKRTAYPFQSFRL